MLGGQNQHFVLDQRCLEGREDLGGHRLFEVEATDLRAQPSAHALDPKRRGVGRRSRCDVDLHRQLRSVVVAALTMARLQT
jgi:hypothetical protein